jgi:predicted HTH transcriptional regulator
VQARGPEALTAQGIPVDTELWRLENFQAFLEYRRAELAQIVNDFLDRVVQEGGRRASDIAGLVSDGEGPTVEFKETARFNLRTGSPDKALESVVAKTVAGFMNAHGGTLVIGVDDSANPVGLDRDLATLSKPNLDGYQLFLRNLLNAAVGTDLCTRVGIEFPTLDGTEVCALRVPAAPRAVWISSGNDKVLYVRSGNSTQPLDSEQAHRYITGHWRD